MSEGKGKKEYPDISPLLRIVGAIWAMGMVTYLLIQGKDAPLILWLVAASAGLGSLFMPVLDFLSGGRLKSDGNLNDKKENQHEH